MVLSEIKWFLKQTNRNKIEVILIIIIGLLIYGGNAQHNEINKLTNERRQSDSIYRSRLNSTRTFYRTQLEDCRESRLQDILRNNDEWLKKFEALYQESDKTYQELKQ